jgi:hypothetical protein
MAWDTIQAILAIVGGVTGPWAVFRQYWDSRSNLFVRQKDDPGYNYVERLDGYEGLLITMLITNRSSQPNSILKYAVTAKLRNGDTQALDVRQGTITIRQGSRILAENQVCVIPLNLAPRATTEAFLHFQIQADQFTHPLVATVVVTDANGKEFAATCSVPNISPVRI